MSMKDQMRRWNKHVEECLSNKVWISSDCEEVPFSKMNEHYIANCIHKIRTTPDYPHKTFEDNRVINAAYLRELLKEMHSRIGPLPDCFCSGKINELQHSIEADCKNCPAMEYCR